MVRGVVVFFRGAGKGMDVVVTKGRGLESERVVAGGFGVVGGNVDVGDKDFFVQGERRRAENDVVKTMGSGAEVVEDVGRVDGKRRGVVVGRLGNVGL